MTTTVTDGSFSTAVLQAEGPVLVDFWAEWCPPCHAIAPALEELSAELDGKVTIAKLNVDENPDIAQRFNVMSIPTLLLFHEGDVQKRIVGAKGKGALIEELDEFLATSR